MHLLYFFYLTAVLLIARDFGLAPESLLPLEPLVPLLRDLRGARDILSISCFRFAMNSKSGGGTGGRGEMPLETKYVTNCSGMFFKACAITLLALPSHSLKLTKFKTSRLS